MTVEPRSVTAFIGPSGCGKSTVLRTLNRMHEVIPGAHVEGSVLLDGEDLYGPRGRPGERSAGRSAWCSSGRTRSPPCRSSTTWRPGLKLKGGTRKKTLEEVGAVAEGGQPVERGQGPAGQARRWTVRRSAAAAVHRPRDRGAARGAADGRAVLGAGPDLHAGHRGPDRGAEGGLHRRHRHPQHAAGRPGERPDRVLQPRRPGQAGQADRDRPRPRRSSPTPTRRRPRTTSAADRVSTATGTEIVVGRDLAQPGRPAAKLRARRRRSTAGSPFAELEDRPARPVWASAQPAGTPERGSLRELPGDPEEEVPIGWWIAGIAMVIVIVVVAVIAIRAVAGGKTDITSPPGGGPAHRTPAHRSRRRARSPRTTPTTVVYMAACSPIRRYRPAWGPPPPDPGAVRTRRAEAGGPGGVQLHAREPAGSRRCWSASCRPALLHPRAGLADRGQCILGAFYGNAQVTSDVRRSTRPRRSTAMRPGSWSPSRPRHPEPEDQGRAADRGDLARVGRGPACTPRSPTPRRAVQPARDLIRSRD